MSAFCKLRANWGYQHKSSAKKTKMKDISIILLAPTLSNLYYPFLLQNIQLLAESKGVKTIILNTLRNSELSHNGIDPAILRAADGLLCLYPPNFPLPPHLPAVIVSEKTLDSPYDTLSLNSYTAGYMMADHLISLGHDKIAYISTPLNNITSSRQNRLDGIRTRLSESGY